MWYWLSVGAAAIVALWLFSVPLAVAAGITLVLGLTLYVIDAIERSGPTAPSKIWIARYGKVLRSVGACLGILVIFESVAFQVIDSDLNQIPQDIPAMIHISLVALAGAMGYLVVYGDMTSKGMGHRSRRWTALMLIGCVVIGTVVHNKWLDELGKTGLGQFVQALTVTAEVKSASAAEAQEVFQVVEGTVFYANAEDKPEVPKELPVKISAGEKLKRLSKAEEFEELRFIKVQRINAVTGDHFGGAVGWVLVSAITEPEPDAKQDHHQRDPNIFRADFQPSQVIHTGFLVKVGDRVSVSTTAPVIYGSDKHLIKDRIILEITQEGELTFEAVDKGGKITFHKV